MARSGMRVTWGRAVMWALFICLSCEARAADEPYYMAEAGATVHLPPSWTMSRWSDWDFKAESNDRSMMMWMFYTPWQVEPTEESARAWSQLHMDRLKEQKAGDVKVTKAVVAPSEQGASARIEMVFRFNGDGPLGVYYGVVFPADGKDLHVATLSGARHDARTRAALDAMVKSLEVVKKSESMAKLSGNQVSNAGFSVELPKGWRRPVLSEVKDVAGLAEKTGHKEVDTEKCVQVIRPVSVGDPDYALFCPMIWYLDPVDAYSWTGLEDQVHRKLFGSSPTPIPTAEKLELPDQLGFYFAPVTGGSAVRMSVVPYDKGIVIGWGLGQKSRESELDNGFRGLIASTAFSGPDNGKQQIGFGQWLSYYLKYRKTSPVVVAPLLLVLAAFGLGVFKMARKKPAPPMYY